jgi:ATP-dependent phosphofructokinase / diphosphate-dependent phosphofructokinase
MDAEASMTGPGKLAIVVGGGPAPGINSVIGAATIRATRSGLSVIGLDDGFEHLMRGDTQHVEPLTIEKVSRMHFRGGSYLGTSRANPTARPEDLDATVRSLEQLGVDQLITIGGDDTAFSAMKIRERGAGRLRVVHVPKTIDNDLDLPPYVDTFGFQTARHVGVELVKNLMVDAKTTGRWYFVVAMGRKAGHLALGIGKAVGATLTIIPEEFPQKTRLSTLVDTLAGAIIKRLAMGRRDGVAIIAEGMALAIDPADFAGLEDVERDDHGNVRIAEIDVGRILKTQVSRRLKALGVKATLVSKDIGYELRCADPIPYDMEYTRDLGYCASQYLLSGGDAAMVSMQGGRFVPVPFRDLVDPATGRTRVRMVDLRSARYAIARAYMLRLDREDFADLQLLGAMAEAANLTVDGFRKQFAYLAELAPSPPPVA